MEFNTRTAMQVNVTSTIQHNLQICHLSFTYCMSCSLLTFKVSNPKYLGRFRDKTLISIYVPRMANMYYCHYYSPYVSLFLAILS